MVFRKNLRSGLVADRPAVNIRKKGLHRLHALVEVLYHGDQEEVDQVLLVEFVWQLCKESFRLLCPPYLLGDPPHIGRSHSQHGLLGDVGHQLALKLLILFIAAGDQPFIYRHDQLSFLKLRNQRDSSAQTFPAVHAYMQNRHPDRRECHWYGIRS